MKKFILSLSALLSLVAGAQTVSVADVEALPGETVTATLSFSAPADTYQGLYFEMQFPATGFATTGNTYGWTGLVQVGEMTDGLVKITPADSKAFTDVALQVEFTVDDAVTLGVYEVKVTNIQFMNDKDKVSVSDITFDVNVVAAHTVVLDEKSTTAPEVADGVNVRVLRTIKANEWSTICLPFAMTEEQCKTAFGSDVEIGDFTGTETEFDDADNVVGIQAKFSSVSAIEANHPYIIKVSEAVTEFTVDGVDIVADEDEAYVEFDNGKTGSRRVVYSGFYGTYHAGTELDEYTLFLNGGKFWYSMGLTQMKAYRAYFAFLDVLTEVESTAARVSMMFDGETTGVDIVRNTAGEDNAYYNLAGQRVAQPGKGLYIKGNKKVIVK